MKVCDSRIKEAKFKQNKEMNKNNIINLKIREIGNQIKLYYFND